VKILFQNSWISLENILSLQITGEVPYCCIKFQSNIFIFANALKKMLMAYLCQPDFLSAITQTVRSHRVAMASVFCTIYQRTLRICSSCHAQNVTKFRPEKQRLKAFQQMHFD
jgi:hypothetical protein